ncbi:MAG: D-2-hydroxyacid dehydrogenase [Bacteroidales bacterium]|nr:D-2-hydroxyacid dehydrogenase [Bacteroidales bacterium]
MIKIVFLDAKTVGEVQNFRILEKQGKLEIYETTDENDIIERCKDKDVIITNKVRLNKHTLENLPKLKLICVAATGMNNIDLDYAAIKGIKVKNVIGYSTESVAQLTFTLLLHLVNRPYYFDNYVKSGAYSKSKMFTHLGFPFWELNGKRLGIIGLGTIGRKVAQIAQGFGMEVAFYSTSGMNNNINYKRFDLDTLLSTSDVISIHAPLNDQTKALINFELMKKMRSCAILLNTGRGGIIVEEDLAKALNENIIGGAGIDVMENEPIDSDNPLLKLIDKEKLVITPHIAWTSIEARQKLIDGLAKNISEFRSTLRK